MIATVAEDLFRTYPIHIRREADDYLQPKYDTITTISLTGGQFGWQLPRDEEDFVGLLESFPPGFATQFQYGLGRKWEYRFLVEAIAKIEGVTEIVMSKGAETRLDAHRYVLGLKRYDQLRRAIDSIARRNQKEAHEDKRLVAYTNLLHVVLPDRFPLRTKKIRPGAIYELVKIGGERTTFSRDDQRAAINLVKAEKEKIAKTDASELLSLKADIEKVTLAALIEKFAAMLTKDLPEARWQEFLKSNPFILSLTFAHPIFMVQDQAYIGGANLRGIGEKVADFLAAQHFTGNLALIEIKKPGTPLLTTIPYRTDLFGPSKEISGALSQILDQRFKLHTNFAQKAYESGLSGVHPYSIQCIVIAGLGPDEQAERKSLELFRHATKDVVIVTFDEMLQKLKEIQQVFAMSERESAATPNAETQTNVPF